MCEGGLERLVVLMDWFVILGYLHGAESPSVRARMHNAFLLREDGFMTLRLLCQAEQLITQTLI